MKNMKTEIGEFCPIAETCTHSHCPVAGKKNIPFKVEYSCAKLRLYYACRKKEIR